MIWIHVPVLLTFNLWEFFRYINTSPVPFMSVLYTLAKQNIKYKIWVLEFLLFCDNLIQRSCILHLSERFWLSCSFCISFIISSGNPLVPCCCWPDWRGVYSEPVDSGDRTWGSWQAIESKRSSESIVSWRE